VALDRAEGRTCGPAHEAVDGDVSWDDADPDAERIEMGCAPAVTDDECRGQPEYLSVVRVEAGREVDPAVPVGPIGMTDPGPRMVTSGGRARIFGGRARGGSHNVYTARW
jgi:hypothetical protein